MILRLGLEDEIGSGTAVSVAKKCEFRGRIVVQRSDSVLDTLDRSVTLGEAVVHKAIQLLTSEPCSARQIALSSASTKMAAIRNCGRPYPMRSSWRSNSLNSSVRVNDIATHSI